MTTIAGGIAGNGAIIGFGSATVVGVSGATIDITGLSNLAFTVPEDSVITSISALHNLTLGLSLIGSTVSVQAQIYRSTTASNVFSPIASTLVTLTPAYTGLIGAGSISSGTLGGLSIPVTAGSRLILVTKVAATGASLLNTVTGTVSGGIGLE